MGNPDDAGMSGLIGDEEGKCIAGFHGYIGWTTNIMVEADSLEAVHLIAGLKYEVPRTESTAGTCRMSGRRRPLHACGVSSMEITRKAYREAKEINGPLGLVTKKLIRLASSASLLECVLRYECFFLAILSFVDDHIILALERKAEGIFPPSRYVFNMVDKLVQIVETLPAKFDSAANKFPILIHQIPFLDWALSCAICWLNFWLSILTHWGSETTKEKEIVVDINCNNNSVEQTIVQEEDSDAIEFQNHDGNETKVCFCPISATSGSESQTGSPKVVRCTYKDAPEKGTGEGIQNSEESTKQMIQSTISSEETSSTEQMIHSTVSGEETSTKGETNESMKQKECIAEEETEEARASKEAAGEGGDNTAAIEGNLISLPANKKLMTSISKEDPILALFESAWHI
ncbi:hypothetical protein POTOM_030389 [Populus tomentosa]|uniref:Uncharacterized protein n=1 Tax=Populus tomentosa TaxID=118781 RepID=A0A8X7Z752_POPTO|nr:hypothetical protein POTOM_030389 [Populus tomentosa]